MTDIRDTAPQIPAKYGYVIIKHNYPELRQEPTFFESKYLKSKKYAMIFKNINKDGSELITHIKYSNDLEALQETAKGFISWYNYPLGVYKSIQGYISELR